MQNNQTGAPAITVTVHAPSSTEPKQFEWQKTLKVGEAADEAATAFGLAADQPSLQKQDGEVLDRNKPLVAEGIDTGAVLDLVSAGGGV